MAIAKSPPDNQQASQQVFSEADARRVAQQHLAELRKALRSDPAEARKLPVPRLRRVGRRLIGERERLGLATESLWRAAVTPHHRLGRLLIRIRLTLRGLVNPPLLIALAIFTLVAVWRLGNLPSVSGSAAEVFASALFGAALIGAIAAAWNDIVRCPFAARRIRRRIARRPWCVLPTTTSRRWAALTARDEDTPVVPREDLYDEVLPGILDWRRSDIQMVVGEPGAGKTTALVGLAERLARMGIVPVVVPIWGEMPSDLIEEAKKRFKRNAASLIGSSAHLDDVWRWLRAQGRVVVAIDDVDRIPPDGERGFMLRRALDELAGAGLPALATTRPSGIPAGLAASAIDLGVLDPEAAVDHVLRVAWAESGTISEDRSATEIRGRVAQWVQEGRFGEVPFYLELLARLVAVGRCEELPPAGAVLSELGDIGRARKREDGQCEWNPQWVRFRLLEHFYAEVVEGHVHQWLAIENRERKSCMEALSEVALATLAATAMRARAGAEQNGRPPSRRKRAIRLKIEEFLESDDRARIAGGERQIVSAHEVVDTGERLRILDRDSSGELHFHHRIMQAYLAGRCLVDRQKKAGKRIEKDWMKVKPPDWIGALLDPCHPERLTAQMALTFASLSASDRASSGSRKNKASPPPLVENILDRFVEEAGESLRGIDSAADGGSNGSDKDAARLDPRAPYNPEQGRADPDDALAKLTTAAEIARATNAKKKTTLRIVRCVREGRGTTRWTKLHAIPSLAGLNVETRWLCMWEFARDPDQEVRRAASEAIADDAFAAYEALESPIRALLTRAALRSAHGGALVPPGTSATRGEKHDGGAGARQAPAVYDSWIWDADKRAPRWNKLSDIPSLRALGWILPAIVNGLQEHVGPLAPTASKEAREGDDGDRRDGAGDAASVAERVNVNRVRGAREALEQLVLLTFQGGNTELEASLAQGFKSDAMRHAGSPGRGTGPGLVANNRRFVTDFCIDRAEYWYARLVLHQALALYAIAGSDRQVAFDVYGRLLHRGREPHPFVWRTARLARRAVRRHAIGSQRWQMLIWVDEGVAVSRRPTELSAASAQLVADVTLLLNLRERASEDCQADFPHMRELPHCLRSSRDRREILGAGCPRSCGYNLCPLRQPPPDEPNGQRTVSRAFCRGQYEFAAYRKPSWQKHIRRSALRRFWRQMERRART